MAEKLSWRVTVLVDNMEISALQVPDLRISISSTQVNIRKSEVPIYDRKHEVHRRITDGKPAGIKIGHHKKYLTAYSK